MADYAYGTGDEELVELKKLEANVQANPDEFENWENLVRAAEGLEGGLNRNSSPQAISAARSIYDRFLAKFPLFFGYWKKYADLEFAIAGTEAAEMVYERGVASIAISVDLWANYCGFKVETSHDEAVIRELFERGSTCVGLDFLAHPFWDKYIEFEERIDAHDKVFGILTRVIHIPMHQYARYFEKYRQLAASRPLPELASEDLLGQFKAELDPTLQGKSQVEIERALRTRLDAYHLEIFHRTQAETTKRWTYEQEIKRPYFHVTELDEVQLENWQKYLDFEETEGDYTRISFLYERCLVTCAHYDEFWARYVRWMYAQEGKEEEVRNIFQRSSCIYTPIARPAIRLQWAVFEESCNRPSVASAIYEGILVVLPGNLEAVARLANLQRRQVGYDAAVEVYQQYAASPECSTDVKGALIAEMARLTWKAKGSADEARQIFRTQQQNFWDSSSFWAGYLSFEMDQPATLQTETEQSQRVKAIHNDIRRKTRLDPEVVKELSQKYMTYLTEKPGKRAAKEYMNLDAEVNGPASVIPIARSRNSASTTTDGNGKMTG